MRCSLLCFAKISRHSDHSFCNGLPRCFVGNALHLLEDDSRELFSVLIIVRRFQPPYADPFRVILSDFEGPVLLGLLDLRMSGKLSDESFDVVN